MILKPTKILMKSCLLLVIALAANSKKDTLESESKDSDSPDSGGVENKMGYEHDYPYLNMRGNLRMTMAYHVLLQDTRKSWLCSPLSALLPLGKLAIGSSSRRYGELKEAIGYKRRKVRRRFKEIMDHMGHLGGKLVLTIASRMYVSRDETIRSKFDSAAREVFRSGAEKADFNDPRRTAEAINRWVSTETNGAIKRTIDPGDISRTSSVIIVNAVYFRGSWKNSFDSVRMDDFNYYGRLKSIKFLYTIGRYNYFSSTHLKAKIVEIPYAGRGISLVIVLPHHPAGLPGVVHQLANLPAGLNVYMKQMRKTTLRLSIPRFRVAADLPMDNIYKKVGLREIFKPDNKVLTKIVRGHNVFVTKSHQTAIFDVDEYGSAGGIISKQLQRPSSYEDRDRDRDRQEFRANHPFLFFVVANDEQLFAGTYAG